MRRITFLVLFVWLSTTCKSVAQSGCTDPQALNYDSNAVQNDGSCLYGQSFFNPVLVTEINHELDEISGLTFAKNIWWTHNDSGNPMQFFELNTGNGEILKTAELDEASNIDWEDITSNSNNLFIGDFGNNRNDRQNLGVYQVPFSVIDTDNQQVIGQGDYHFIPFAWPDQVDFSTVPEDSAVYDCEAMLYFQGKLHLFTKNHRDYTTTHYTLDPQTQAVEKIETLNTNGMITGADISPDSQVIALTGYNLREFPPTVFCWLLWDWQAGSELFFSGNKRRIELGSALTAGQVEGIGFFDKRKAYISNEITKYMSIVFVQPQIKGLDFSQYVPAGNTGVDEPRLKKEFRVQPNPANNFVNLLWPADMNRPALVQLFDGQGVMLFSDKAANERLDLRPYPSGCYTIRVIWENGASASRRVIRQ